MPFCGGHYGGLAPYPKRAGGRAPDEALYLESFKRAFPDVYSRDLTSKVVAEHIAHAREKASVGRAIATIVNDSLPHTAHLSLLDWARKLGVAVQPDWGPAELSRACVEVYEAQAKNDIISLRSELSRLLGDSFVRLKRPLDKRAKVVSCCATSIGSVAPVPVYPLIAKGSGSSTVDGTSAVVAECVPATTQEVEFSVSAPGTLTAMLSVAFTGATSVWADGYAVTSSSATGRLAEPVTAVDGCTAIIAFVVIESDVIDYREVLYDGNELDFIGETSVADGARQLYIAAYYLATSVEGISGDIEVTIDAFSGGSSSVKLFWSLLEDIDSPTFASSTDGTTTGNRMTTEHSVSTDVDDTFDAPVPTYWEGNPAPESVAQYVLDGWTSARARYLIQARRGSRFTSDDAVRQQLDGPVHAYLDRVLKSTECYDYSIGDLEGFIIGQSRLGYVAILSE